MSTGLSPEAMLRLNVVLKSDPSRKVSIICKGTLRIQQLKRRIEGEFWELHSLSLLLSHLQDSSGFTLSNNSCICDHARSGDILYASQDEVEIGKRMKLGNNLLDNFTTLRYVSNSFGDKLLSLCQSTTLPSDLKLQDLIPQFMHLGFWYTNQVLMLRVAECLNHMCSQAALREYFSNNNNQIQKGLMLSVFHFWFQEIDRNPSVHKQLLLQTLELLQKLNQHKPFVGLFQTHPVVKVLVQLVKNQQIQTALQKRILSVLKGGKGSNTQPRPYSKGQAVTGQPYVPSFIKSNGFSGSQEVQPILDMLNSNSQEQWCLALSLFEKDVKPLVTQCTVRATFFDKAMNGLFKRMVPRSAERVWLSVAGQFASTMTRQRAFEQLCKNGLIPKIHNFVLESPQERVRAMSQKLLATMARLTNSSGNFIDALQVIGSPYSGIQLVALKLVLSASEQSTNLPHFVSHFSEIAKVCLESQVDLEAQRVAYKIMANLALNSECRNEFLRSPLDLLGHWVVRLTSGDVQIQRACARTLLNLSLSSGRHKSTVLERLLDVTTLMYKGILDKGVEKYLQTLFKTNTESY